MTYWGRTDIFFLLLCRCHWSCGEVCSSSYSSLVDIIQCGLWLVYPATNVFSTFEYMQFLSTMINFSPTTSLISIHILSRSLPSETVQVTLNSFSTGFRQMHLFLDWSTIGSHLQLTKMFFRQGSVLCSLHGKYRDTATLPVPAQTYPKTSKMQSPIVLFKNHLL